MGGGGGEEKGEQLRTQVLLMRDVPEGWRVGSVDKGTESEIS